MDILTVIRARRSIRKFRTRKPSKAKILRVLEAARLAPSGANRQPLLAVVVDDHKVKADIGKMCEKADEIWWRMRSSRFRGWAQEVGISLRKDFVTSAPYLLCIFGDCKSPYWLESVWIAIGYITLVATEQGPGCLTYTPGTMRFLNSLLGVPVRFNPVAIIPLGFPAEMPSDRGRGRKRLEEIAFQNRYGTPIARALS